MERLKEIDIDDKELQKIISIQDDKTFVIDKIEFVKEQLSDDLNIVNLLRHDDFKGNKGNFRKNMIVLRLLFFTTILNFLNEKPEHFVSSSSPGIAIKNIFNINSARNIAESQTGCDFSLSSSDFYNLSFSDLWTKKIQPYLSNCLEPIVDKRNAATTLAYIEALKKSYACAFSDDNSLEAACSPILNNMNKTELKVELDKITNDKNKLRFIKKLQLELMNDFCGTTFSEFDKSKKFTIDNSDVVKLPSEMNISNLDHFSHNKSSL